MNTNDIFKLISNSINNAQYEIALNMIRDFERQIKEKRYMNSDVELNICGMLIDVGIGKSDASVIDEGISRLKKLLASYNEKTYVYYNMANGYMGLFKVLENTNNDVTTRISSLNLQLAKKYFRKAIKNIDNKTLNLSQIWTDYGGCLDTLGRRSEAFISFNKAIEAKSDFSMAIANKGTAYFFFSNIAGKNKDIFLIKAYQLIESVIEKDDLIEFGTIKGKAFFADILSKIESRFTDKSLLRNQIIIETYDDAKCPDFEKFYYEFALKHNLFLNFCLTDDRSIEALKDSISINRKSKQVISEQLIQYVEQIKEDYLVARLLLVESQFKREELLNINKNVDFATFDKQMPFGIYQGLMKLAFVRVYNILDKIAGCLNLHLELGLKEEEVFFDNIWQSKKEHEADTKMIDEKIESVKNIDLFALYDLHRDFMDNRYYDWVKGKRNDIIHRCLPIKSESDEKKMIIRTIELFQVVKSAIISFISYAQTEL